MEEFIYTPDRLPSTYADRLLLKNSVFDCQLSPVGRQMAIENSVSKDFYLHSSIVLTFSIAT